MRKNHKRRNRKSRKKPFVPRTKREAQILEKVLAAVSLSRRENLEIRLAARVEGTRLSTIRRYAPSALENRKDKYRAKPYDRIPRTLTVIDSKGMRPLSVRSSRSASKIARYLNAVRTFIYKDDESVLAPFRGKKIAGYRFVTNVGRLKQLADAGLLSLDRLYAGGNAWTLSPLARLPDTGAEPSALVLDQSVFSVGTPTPSHSWSDRGPCSRQTTRTDENVPLTQR
jgi:hypothetical protein